MSKTKKLAMHRIILFDFENFHIFFHIEVVIVT